MQFKAPDKSVFPNRISTGDFVDISTLAEFIDLTTKWYLYSRFERFNKALAEGFHDVITVSVFAQGFINETELAEIMFGETLIELDDLKASVKLEGYQADSDQILWLWRFLEDGGNERRLRFFKFASGFLGLSLGGIRGMNPLVIHRTDYDPIHPIPAAHTLHYRIDLPAYTSEQEFRGYLGAALVRVGLEMKRTG